MPIEVAIWKLGAKPKPVSFTALNTESRLEEMLVHGATRPFLCPEYLVRAT